MDNPGTAPHNPQVTRRRPPAFPASLAALFLLLLAAGRPAQAAPPIAPPWGLGLGDPAHRVQKTLAAAGLHIAAKQAGPDGEVWSLGGFSQENLTGVRLHFDSRSRLAEVELLYGNPAWTPAQFNGFAAFFLSKLQSDYGPALLIERRDEPRGAVRVTIECYQWLREKIRLRCVRFSAETLPAPPPPGRKKSSSKTAAKRPPQSFHYDTISLHYRLAPRR